MFLFLALFYTILIQFSSLFWKIFSTCKNYYITCKKPANQINFIHLAAYILYPCNNLI